MSTKDTSCGLAALGKAGRFTVEVDEYIESENYSCSINAGDWCVELDWGKRVQLKEIHEFICRHEDKCQLAEIEIGRFGNGSAWLIKDIEFEDRFFLSAGRDRSGFRVVLINNDARELKLAIADAIENFEM